MNAGLRLSDLMNAGLRLSDLMNAGLRRFFFEGFFSSFVGVCRGVVGVKKQATPTKKNTVSIYDYHVYVGVVGVISIYMYMFEKKKEIIECS